MIKLQHPINFITILQFQGLKTLPKMTTSLRVFYLISISICFFSCEDKKQIISTPPPLVKKETTNTNINEVPVKGPIVNIIDTVEIKRIVLCVKDSSATSVGLSEKLSNILKVKIPGAITAAKIKAVGQPIAWYKSQKPPFFFEVGIPVDKAPAKMIKGFFIKKTGGDSALVAHFYGPNMLSSIGYDALNEMLKEQKRKRSSSAYEIYIDNPFEVKKGKIDAYKQQTDIVFPYR